MTSPTLKPSQKEMIEVLLSKRGWSAADFTRHAGKSVGDLTQAEARRWITRLTKETKGKPHAGRVNPPPPTPPVSHRPREAHSAQPMTLATATEQIVAALGATQSQRSVIEQRVRAVGPQRAILALERLQAAPTTAPGGWELSLLERWLAACG